MPRNGLSGLVVGNFKAFGGSQKIPVRPLTLIYGPNSAGKSSLIQSMLLLNHWLAGGALDAHQTRLGGASLDLGGFRQCIHAHDFKRCLEIGMNIDVDPIKAGERYLGEFKRVGVRYSVGLPEPAPGNLRLPAEPQLAEFTLLLDDCLLMRLVRHSDNRLYAEEVNCDHPVIRSALEALILEARKHPPHSPGSWSPLQLGALSLSDEDPKPSPSPPPTAEELAQDKARHEERLIEHKKLLEELAALSADSEHLVGAIAADFRKVPFVLRRCFPMPTPPDSERNSYAYSYPDYDYGAIHDSLGDDVGQGSADWVARVLRFEVERFFPTLELLVRRMSSRLSYLGPLRCYPARYFSGMSEQDPEWLSGGGRAWEELRRNPEALKAVNEWLTTPARLAKSYELVVRDLAEIPKLAPELAAGLEDALGKLHRDPDSSITAHVETLLKDLMASKPAGVRSDIILRDTKSGTEVSHRDIGQGISQVLPVLVSSFAAQGQIIAIEQPELHLHPALESELGDVFIDSALGKRENTLLIESHSEHLLLRIMRRIRETHNGTLGEGKLPITPDDVSVLYVEPLENRSIVREMPLNVRGELIKDWPGGFFEEGLREVLT